MCDLARLMAARRFTKNMAPATIATMVMTTNEMATAVAGLDSLPPSTLHDASTSVSAGPQHCCAAHEHVHAAPLNAGGDRVGVTLDAPPGLAAADGDVGTRDGWDADG